MKIGLIHQISDGYTGIMQECEYTATTYNLLTNYLLLREILIKCYKHSRKQVKCHLVNDNAKCNVFYDTRHNFAPVLDVENKENRTQLSP